MTMDSPRRIFTREAYADQDAPLQFGASRNDFSTSGTRLPNLQVRIGRVPKLFVPSPPSVVASSPTGMIQVLGYTPTEGERGVPITVHINFHQESLEAVYIRLVVGHKAVATKVRELSNAIGGWQLEAFAPPFDRQQSASAKVLVTVQALNEKNSILDSVTFGEFSYWVSECSSPRSQRTPDLPYDDPTQNINPTHILPITTCIVSDRPSVRRYSSTHLPSPSPTFSDRVPPCKGRQRKDQLHRRVKSQSLMRAKYVASGDPCEDVYAQTPILDLVTPLETICCGWGASELHVGRRLVRFRKLQAGHKLIVSCEPIGQEDYRESDSVISCIYREEAEKCFVTSVDIIYLLERLTNDEFPVEEKNRIRRNLEGLRPTTVSKHKPGFEHFFQRIMEFPDPKPRNIEKDLKVFEWTLLRQALDKILSKYSIYTSSPTGSTSPLQIEPTFTGSPQPVDLQLEYPPDDQIQPTYVDPTVITKCEPLPDDILLASSSGEPKERYTPSVASVAATASSTITPSVYGVSMYASDMSNTQESDSSSGSWVSEPNMGDFGLDRFHTPTAFAVAQPGVHVEAYAEVGGYCFNAYDSLEFQTMREDMASNSDHFL